MVLPQVVTTLISLTLSTSVDSTVDVPTGHLYIIFENIPAWSLLSTKIRLFAFFFKNYFIVSLSVCLFPKKISLCSSGCTRTCSIA